MKQIVLILLILSSLTVIANEDKMESDLLFAPGLLSIYLGNFVAEAASEEVAAINIIRYTNWIETSLRREVSIKNATKHLEFMKTELRKGKLPRFAIRNLARSAALLGAFIVGYEIGEYLNEHTKIGESVAFVGEHTGAFSLMMNVENKYYDLENYLYLSTKEMLSTNDEYDFYDISP